MIEYLNTSNPTEFKLESFEDSRGFLSVLPFTELPFIPKRLFAVTPNLNLEPRGKHAHKNCWQLIIVTAGALKINYANNSTDETLNLVFGQALLVPPWNWCEVIFESINSSFVVLASHLYDENDYITERPNSAATEIK